MVLRCTALLVLDLSSKLHAWRGVSVLWLHFYTVSRDEEVYDDTIDGRSAAAFLSCVEWNNSFQQPGRSCSIFQVAAHISNYSAQVLDVV